MISAGKSSLSVGAERVDSRTQKKVARYPACTTRSFSCLSHDDREEAHLVSLITLRGV